MTVTPLSCGNSDKIGGHNLLRGYQIPAPPLCQLPCGSVNLTLPAVEGRGMDSAPPLGSVYGSAVPGVVGGFRLCSAVLLFPVVRTPLAEVGVVPVE